MCSNLSSEQLSREVLPEWIHTNWDWASVHADAAMHPRQAAHSQSSSQRPTPGSPHPEAHASAGAAPTSEPAKLRQFAASPLTFVIDELRSMPSITTYVITRHADVLRSADNAVGTLANLLEHCVPDMLAMIQDRHHAVMR